MEALNLKVTEVMDIPPEYEAEFLDYIANRLELDPTASRIFKERLSRDNLEDEWSDIIKSLHPKVTEEQAKRLEKQARDNWSKKIIPKLKEWGFNYEDRAKRLWVPARKWLAETQYEPWLWEMLAERAQRTQQMGFIEAKAQQVADLARHRRPQPYVQQVQVGSELILEMTLTETANLTLLAREADGAVVCFCPSGEYAPKSLLRPGKHKLPQEQATYQTFAAGEIGKEQWLALLTPLTPSLEWLAQSHWEPLELRSSHLQGVLEYVKQNTQARLLYAEYEVV